MACWAKELEARSSGTGVRSARAAEEGEGEEQRITAVSRPAWVVRRTALRIGRHERVA
jgi:hypothetical protein